MTDLERLIEQRLHAAIGPAVSRATDTIAAEMAQEILMDPVFRQELHALLLRVCRSTLTAPATEHTP